MVHCNCLRIEHYSYFNDMPVFEILKRIRKIPIVEPTEQGLYKGGGYIYSDKIDEFVESIYHLGLTDKLTGIFPKYEFDKYHKKGIDALSIYEILVMLSANVTVEKFCDGNILGHVQNGDFKNRVLKLQDLESQVTEENVDTPEGGKIIYGITKDIRRFKPLLSFKKFIYAKTMPDVPHFYLVINKLKDKDKKLIVLFDRFQYYLKYFGKIFSRNGELCQMIEHNNYYYRIYRGLLYRIPMTLETFENDMKNIELDTYFGTLDEIRKNWKSTVEKIKKGKQLTPIKHNWSGTIYEDGHVEHHKGDKWANY